MTAVDKQTRKEAAIVSVVSKPVGLLLLGTAAAPIGVAVLIFGAVSGVVALTGQAGSGNKPR